MTLPPPLWECRGDLNRDGTVLALDALLPRTRYTVAAEVTDNEGVLHTGETWFETGLMDEPWQAKWHSGPWPSRRDRSAADSLQTGMHR